jgi:hypothetical protein
MSNPDEFADDAHDGGAVDPRDAADEAFLFAVARNPARYEPLNDAESAAIGAWVHGAASAAETDLARSAIRRNLAAKEFVLSLRLDEAAAAGPPVPARVSKAILRQMAPAGAWSIGNFVGLPSIRNWQFAGLGAVAAAAIVTLIVIRHPNESDNVRFQVAALSDRSVLGDSDGWVTRGAKDAVPNAPPTGQIAAKLEFFECNVPVSVLRELFGVETQGDDALSHAALIEVAHLVRHTQENEQPSLIFDRDLEATVKGGIAADMVTLRVYDLTVPSNAILARALPAAAGTKVFFVTLVLEP